MKKIFLVILSFFFLSTSYSEVSPADTCKTVDPWPYTNAQVFMNQFEEAAYCNCKQSGYSYEYCKYLGINKIYQLLLVRFGNIRVACEKGQKAVPPKLCVAQWNEYLKLHPMYK